MKIFQRIIKQLAHAVRSTVMLRPMYLVLLLVLVFGATPVQDAEAQEITWAFEETFDGDPSAPSQALLPTNFDYVVTHRTHPKAHFDPFSSFPADHGDDCAGPNPAVSPLPQHSVTTSHFSNGANPDQSFFVCKNHMMSSMGDVSGYSVTAFWPKQEFNFANGGVLEFDVNINGNHPRSWWEVMLVPRGELKVGPAREWLPIDEVYPKDRIVFEYMQNKRKIQVGTAALDPNGKIVDVAEWGNWEQMFAGDPATTDRRIRRTMRMTFNNDQLIWAIEKADGSFDEYSVNVPGGLPFDQGLVVFKTHAYTPQKDGNTNTYTFHWDNIRFSGPVLGRYENFEAAPDDVAYLQANGSVPIGTSDAISIDLPQIGPNPILFGQVHNPMRGQVQLSINGREPMAVNPYDYPDGCSSQGWKSFQVALDPAWLQDGENTFQWTVGQRPDCVGADWPWDGFSIKSLEVQFDLDDGADPGDPPPIDPVDPTPTDPADPTPSKLSGTVQIDLAGASTPIDDSLLGSNLPAWLVPSGLADATFRERTAASGVSLIRMPGGSWSNYYGWYSCEQGSDQSGALACGDNWASWAARPTDFIDFMQATGMAGMWVISPLATPQEAAAAVAFFNADVNDATVIGVDRNGTDWRTAGDWAQLRADHGNPDPVGIALWAVGNELYGSKPSTGGSQCQEYGWESYWTCDGVEYVNGTTERDGFVDYVAAMKAVDPSIQIGAVGTPTGAEFNNWGNEVIASAGTLMDFYDIHQYAFFDPPADYATMLAQPHGVWTSIMADIDASFGANFGNRTVPVAVTEYNLFSVHEQDSGQLMNRMGNALFMADTIGQLATEGVAMANQWNLANGASSTGTEYGLMQPSSWNRSPQYYVFPLWAKFGSEILPHTSSLDAASEVSVYTGRVDDDTVSLLAINKSDQPATLSISAVDDNGSVSLTGGLVDRLEAASLDAETVTYNGVPAPNNDLSDAPATALGATGTSIDYSVPANSIVLLRVDLTNTPEPPATNTPEPPATNTPEPPATNTPEPPVTSTPEPPVTSTPEPPAGVLTIYDEGLATGWQNWSWGISTNFAATSPVHAGNLSLSVTYTAGWGGLSLRAPSPVNTASYNSITFWAHGGASGNQNVQIYLQESDSGNPLTAVPLSIPAQRWTQYTIPLADLGAPAQIARITIQDRSGGVQPTFYLDNLLLASVTVPEPTLDPTPEPTPTELPPGDPEDVLVYLTSATRAEAGGVKFANEDIVAVNLTTGLWSLVFNGSDVGLSRRSIDAFALLADGTIVFSLRADGELAGFGFVDDSDILRFVPERLGEETSGTLEWYVDGSDIGLDTNGEDIDALSTTTNGGLVLSFVGGFNVSSVSGRDEDLVLFSPTRLGEQTEGTWAPYFDGSDVELDTNNDEDIDGVHVEAETIYMTTRDAFSAQGVFGRQATIFTCTPISFGTETYCTIELFLDGYDAGFVGRRINGIALETVDSALDRGLLVLPADSIEVSTTSVSEEMTKHDSARDVDDEGNLLPDIDGSQPDSVFLPILSNP